ncbi:MAG: AI-2E family transporter [Solobacterium sp.]|nr:AI-2E family transporter [Solobacterium sp.]
MAGFFGKVLNALTPFAFGLAITFVAMPLRNIVEDKWLAKLKWKQSTKRRVSVFVAMVIFILIIASFFMVLIPQLSDSISMLIANMEGYMATLQGFIAGLSENSQWAALADAVYENFRTTIMSFITGTAGVVSRVVTYSVSLVRGVFNFLIGMIIAVYLLSDSERFISQAAAVCYSLLPKHSADRVIEVANLSGQMLNRFIFGKLLDSLIIGIFCYIMTELLTIPYAPLISFIVGITNMIPVFGPFIGAVPAIFILLIIQPSKALEFAIFIIILQQIDGNIIGPYILGDSMGLPPIWIMFAIIVGGAVGGVLGMFLGVPIFSVIYVLFTRFIKRQLAEKNIKINP